MWVGLIASGASAVTALRATSQLVRSSNVARIAKVPDTTIRPGGTIWGAGKALKVPGRVQSRINVSNDSWTHVINEHFNPAKNKSQFTVSQDELRSLLNNKSVVNSPVVGTLNVGDKLQYVREVNIGYNIGIDKFSSNSPTSIMTILTDSKGNLITATPGLIAGVMK